MSVNKGDWDRSHGREQDCEFNRQWLSECRRLLKDDGTLWCCGTYHNIFNVADNLSDLGYKILNVVTWAKTNPPPNIPCRFFTHSSEFIIWARKYQKVPHYYNYELMKRINGDTQMTDVWRLPAIAPWEKVFGKHPTQKPLKLLHRIILAASRPGDLFLDPFTGSSTTGIAANLLGCRYVGIDSDVSFLELSIKRRNQIDDPDVAKNILSRLNNNPDESMVLINHVRKEARKLMEAKGICYVRAGSSKGSLLVKEGFNRLQYVVLHTNGENPKMFRLKLKGLFQIWTAEDLRKQGFMAEHAPCYVVLHFSPTKEIAIDTTPDFKRSRATYLPQLRPLSDFITEA